MGNPLSIGYIALCHGTSTGMGFTDGKSNHERKEEMKNQHQVFRFSSVVYNPIKTQIRKRACRRLSLVERVALRDTAASIAKTLHRPVVRPASELLLHRLTEHRAVHVAVCRRFAGEFLVKVGRVTLIQHRRLERGLVFAIEKLAPVYAVEEWVCLFLS